MELTGKRVAIFVENFYQEMEAWYPLFRLREAGAEVVTVGPEAGVTYKSKLGYPIKADRAVDDVSAADFDAVIVPGGYAPDYMRRTPGFVRVLREADAAGKPIATICHAAWMLCSARIIQGRRVTCFFAIKDDVINAGGNYVDEEVVVDGHLITSRVPDDLPAFCREIIRVMAEAAAPAGVGAGSRRA